MKKRPAYVDLHRLSEDDRIAHIGAQVERGLRVGFVLDNDRKTVARYKEKLLTRFPFVRIDYEGVGPIPSTWAVIVERKKSEGTA